MPCCALLAKPRACWAGGADWAGLWRRYAGMLRLASLVQYLPLPVVGGYLVRALPAVCSLCCALQLGSEAAAQVQGSAAPGPCVRCGRAALH